MKIAQINTCYEVGSTGKICYDLSLLLTKKGIENYILYYSGKSKLPNTYKCSVFFYEKIQALKARILGNYGFNSHISTALTIYHLNKIKPDIVHIHNIHGHEVNMEILLKYLEKKRIRVVWTLHDCWTYTGYCTHYTLVKCDQWTKECKNCPLKKKYSWFFDRSNEMYRKKRKLFANLDVHIVTPSIWLMEQAKKSFLQSKPIRVINNGISLDVFKSTESNIRKDYKCENKILLLGVAAEWSNRKGIDVFWKLAQKLDENYQIVLIGKIGEENKKCKDKIIYLSRTNNAQELAKWYSAADLYINPTREENYPTVNLESIACGTPVITYRTGGSPEMVGNDCGIAVEYDNFEVLYQAIINVTDMGKMKKNCLKKREEFDRYKKYEEYYELYSEISRIGIKGEVR